MGKQIMNGVTYGKPREILEVTQAQYDALSQAQKMNGTLYCIKDDGIVEGEKFAPVIYSTGEREIGTWIDGKPLYQKTIDMGTLSADTYKTVLYADVGIDNLEHVAYIDIIVNDTYNVCFNRPDNVNTEFYSQLTPTGIFLRAYNTAVTKAIATIRYTKTTDVPGSGQYATNGVPAVHYSTDEQVIGTWIDGKPLYQKIFYIQNDSSTISNTLYSDLNINWVIDSYIMIYNGSVLIREELGYNRSTKLLTNIPANKWIYFISVQYTKTTD